MEKISGKWSKKVLMLSEKFLLSLTHYDKFCTTNVLA